MRPGRSGSPWNLSPAALAAGLLFLAAIPSAAVADGEAPPPARSVAPAGSASPSSVQINGLRDKVAALDSRAQSQQDGLDDQARRVSAAAAAVAEQAASLRDLTAVQARLEQRLAAAEQALSQAQARLQSLDEGEAKAGVALGAESARVDALAPQLAAFKQELSNAQDSLQASAKDYAATRATLEERSSKLDSLSELLGVLRQGLQTDDEELVEVKQALKRLEPKETDASLDNLAWWDQLLTWKYLPAVATGLGIIAVGTSLSHK